MEKVGGHVGGYDEWTVDLTSAIAKSKKPTDVPLAVLCDNSRDAEMIPSDLSDFNRYGGIYRHVTLTYVPAISLKRVHIEPILTVEGKASVEIRARLFNPKSLKEDVELKLEISDQIEVAYQTAAWGKPAKLELKAIARKDGTATIEASVIDKAGVPCLDAANLVRFGVTGDGSLLDNLGTVGGSRVVQLANGRAQITVELTGPAVVASVSSDGLITKLLNLNNPE